MDCYQSIFSIKDKQCLIISLRTTEYHMVIRCRTHTHTHTHIMATTTAPTLSVAQLLTKA